MCNCAPESCRAQYAHLDEARRHYSGLLRLIYNCCFPSARKTILSQPWAAVCRTSKLLNKFNISGTILRRTSYGQSGRLV
jgi:hypothetical protein